MGTVAATALAQLLRPTRIRTNKSVHKHIHTHTHINRRYNIYTCTYIHIQKHMVILIKNDPWGDKLRYKIKSQETRLRDMVVAANVGS